MPKIKTHKGTKKVLKVRKGGTIAMGKPGSRHNTGKKNASANRKNRRGIITMTREFRRTFLLL